MNFFDKNNKKDETKEKKETVLYKFQFLNFFYFNFFLNCNIDHRMSDILGMVGIRTVTILKSSSVIQPAQI